MRSSKSRSRAKNRGANRSPANNINRVFDSSGPEGKVRGTPQQIIDKYTQLSRDAFLAGDRVAGENFQQHAEHYTRMLSEAQRDAEEKRQQHDQQSRDRQQNDQQSRDRQQKQQHRDRDDQRDRSRESNPNQPEAPVPAKAADVLDLGGTGAARDSGLVDTPEEQPQKQPARARKPRAKAPKPAISGEAAPAKDEAKPADEPKASEPAPEAPEAPEAAAS